MKKFLAAVFFIFLIIPTSYAQEVVPGEVIVVLRNNSGFRVSSANSVGGLQNLSAVQSFTRSVSAKVSQTYDSLSEQSGNIFMVIHSDAKNESDLLDGPALSTSYYDGKPEYYKGYYEVPGSFLGIDNMINVAAADSNLNRADFSNYSRKYVDIAAPGDGIYSTYPLTISNDWDFAVLPVISPYDLMSGTSMAAPHVAGSAALLKAMYPEATASQIKAALLGGANGEYLRDDGTSAHGLLDLTGAINFMAAVMSESSAPKISDANVPDGGLGQRYKTEFFASGTQPIEWEIDGELPEGLTFEDGRISGTPRESGTFPFTVTALNDYGESSLMLTLNIADAIAPVLDMSTLSYDTLASTDCVTEIMTSAGTWPMFWSIESGDIPADFRMRITRSSGLLRFTPTRAGTFTFPVHVSNDAGQDSATFTLRVEAAKAPEILYTSDLALSNATLGRRYQRTARKPLASAMGMNGQFSIILL